MRLDRAQRRGTRRQAGPGVAGALGRMKLFQAVKLGDAN
jgi:hypothetical protein